LGGAPVADI